MATRSLEDILLEAHREIREKHGVALETVHFNLINTGTMSKRSWTPEYVEVEGKAETLTTK